MSSVKPLWPCPQDCELNSDWRNGVPIWPAPVIGVCGSPPSSPFPIAHSNACVLAVSLDITVRLDDTVTFLPFRLKVLSNMSYIEFSSLSDTVGLFLCKLAPDI